jgi:superfamily II DNA/RNA helicase
LGKWIELFATTPQAVQFGWYIIFRIIDISLTFHLQLQRVGRTGRKRKGYVDVLLAEDREELKWQKALQSYKEVQDSITGGEQLELYQDVKRLLPEHLTPRCLQTVVDTETEGSVSGTINVQHRSPKESSTPSHRNSSLNTLTVQTTGISTAQNPGVRVSPDPPKKRRNYLKSIRDDTPKKGGHDEILKMVPLHQLCVGQNAPVPEEGTQPNY